MSSFYFRTKERKLPTMFLVTNCLYFLTHFFSPSPSYSITGHGSGSTELWAPSFLLSQVFASTFQILMGHPSLLTLREARADIRCVTSEVHRFTVLCYFPFPTATVHTLVYYHAWLFGYHLPQVAIHVGFVSQ